MRLEHVSDQVIPLRHFIRRLFQYLLFSSALILISIALGVAGYRYFSGLNWVDSFHMSSMILTGMGPVVEMKSDEAKLFSSFYALYSGLAFVCIAGVFLAPIIHRVLHILHIKDR
jgi:hypothetical protein